MQVRIAARPAPGTFASAILLKISPCYSVSFPDFAHILQPDLYK